MAHSIILLKLYLDCLIALATGELRSILQTLKQDCIDLDTFILESSSEQPDAHELLEVIQEWAQARCAAQNVGDGCEDDAKNYSALIHEYI